jgi:hypothetical protein
LSSQQLHLKIAIQHYTFNSPYWVLLTREDCTPTVTIIPLERIYIKESKPLEFSPQTLPIGFVEGSRNYIVLSYGTLLKQNEEEFYAQFLRFNTAENASSYFSKVIEEFKKAGVEVESSYSKERQRAVIYGDKMVKYGLAILNNEKIFYFSGDETKIEKVVKWFISQNS